MSERASPRDQLIARLEDLGAAGLDGLARRATRQVEGRTASPAKQRASAPTPPDAPARAGAASGCAASTAADAEWSGLGLDDLAVFLRDCQRCKLSRGRTQVVFGVGAPRARLMFIGEGPGREEDLQGEPFVGRAGKLLTEMIEKGMGLARADVYIANVVKCRPPDNRNPEPDEVMACSGFLRRQVEVVQPEVVVALGRIAAQALLATTTPIGQLRGRWRDFAGTPLMPTFHPAYLLRNPQDKRLVWEDLKLVMARLGLALPG